MQYYFMYEIYIFILNRTVTGGLFMFKIKLRNICSLFSFVRTLQYQLLIPIFSVGDVTVLYDTPNIVFSELTTLH